MRLNFLIAEYCLFKVREEVAGGMFHGAVQKKEAGCACQAVAALNCTRAVLAAVAEAQDLDCFQTEKGISGVAV